MRPWPGATDVPKVYVIQQPRHEGDYDMGALRALGDVEFILPAAPNIHDQERITADLKHMAMILSTAAPTDIFVTLGGAPLSQMLFGAAFVTAGRRSINYGLFSRGIDGDGRRGASRGSYRLIPVDLGADDPVCAPAAS